ncbi:hypothetical protein V6N13_126728 [Hibiscus sabdariffa]|uniref:Aminotransferase class I/classII large domain-containing protein n=1 Tax=Hibiscus sabdariffa TaxID=183260 RepID=A0ABR2RES4_9ROSI
MSDEALWDKTTGLGRTTSAYNYNGVKGLHNTIVAGIKARDDIFVDPNDFFLTNGASPGVHMMMQLLIRFRKDEILCRIPQYTLHFASKSLVPYYFDEATRWGLEVSDLKKKLETIKSREIDVRTLVVLNQDNPTGHVLAKKDQKKIVKFCKEEFFSFADRYDLSRE